LGYIKLPWKLQAASIGSELKKEIEKAMRDRRSWTIGGRIKAEKTYGIQRIWEIGE
jgi:hypothetical protein